MQSRLPHWLSAAFVAGILLPGVAPAQVSLFTQGPGLSPEDNRLLFESIARLIAAKPARVGPKRLFPHPVSPWRSISAGLWRCRNCARWSRSATGPLAYGVPNFSARARPSMCCCVG
jgi:hypothetical protein